MDELLTGTAAKQLGAILGKRDSVESLLYRCTRDMTTGRNLQRDEFMHSISAVKNDGKLATRVHGDINREIADQKLSSSRSEKPLIWEPNRPVVLNSRKVPNRTTSIGLLVSLKATATS